MGFKVAKNVPPMERELIYLLADLCVKWGFCIPPDKFEEISKRDYYHADDFALDVLEAEGMELINCSGWAKKISKRFRERFGREEIESSTFTDRIRGEKECWG